MLFSVSFQRKTFPGDGSFVWTVRIYGKDSVVVAAALTTFLFLVVAMADSTVWGITSAALACGLQGSASVAFLQELVVEFPITHTPMDVAALEAD